MGRIVNVERPLLDLSSVFAIIVCCGVWGLKNQSLRWCRLINFFSKCEVYSPKNVREASLV